MFKCGLSSDWKLIKRTRIGSEALRDILDWHDSEHIQEQGQIANNLVQQLMSANFPLASAGSWGDVPGAGSLMMHEVHALEGKLNKPPRLLDILVFNTPNARYAINLQEIAGAIASMLKNT